MAVCATAATPARVRQAESPAGLKRHGSRQRPECQMLIRRAAFSSPSAAAHGPPAWNNTTAPLPASPHEPRLTGMLCHKMMKDEATAPNAMIGGRWGGGRGGVGRWGRVWAGGGRGVVLRLPCLNPPALLIVLPREGQWNEPVWWVGVQWCAAVQSRVVYVWCVARVRSGARQRVRGV